MRSFGFRRALPVIQVALFLVLLAPATNPGRLGRLDTPVQQLQEGQIRWDPQFVNGPPPLRFQIAMALNLPAALMATPVILGLAFVAEPVVSQLPEWAAGLLLAPFVAYWWFLVGRWIDRRLGWAPDPHPTQDPAGKLIAQALVVLSLLAFCMSFWYRSPHGDETLRFASPWLLFGSAVFLRRARRPVVDQRT